MAYPKSSKSAFLALAAAGGMWAWKNRDKVSGWATQLSSQLKQQPGYRKTISATPYTPAATPAAQPYTGSTTPAVESYTGSTQRIGDEANEI